PCLKFSFKVSFRSGIHWRRKKEGSSQSCADQRTWRPSKHGEGEARTCLPRLPRFTSPSPYFAAPPALRHLRPNLARHLEGHFQILAFLILSSVLECLRSNPNLAVETLSQPWFGNQGSCRYEYAYKSGHAKRDEWMFWTGRNYWLLNCNVLVWSCTY